ncbi:MAG TPA: ABC transporter substrate-binding protein, partial [Acetobacteraceae bacterium]
MSPMLPSRRQFIAGGLASAAYAGSALGQTPQRGGTLRSIINPEPPSLNLGFSQLEPMRTVGSKIYQGLL